MDTSTPAAVGGSTKKGLVKFVWAEAAPRVWFWWTVYMLAKFAAMALYLIASAVMLVGGLVAYTLLASFGATELVPTWVLWLTAALIEVATWMICIKVNQKDQALDVMRNFALKLPDLRDIK